ncbi:hypothetical protein ABPG75_004573 [Micractinium tetrahymenae]
MAPTEAPDALAAHLEKKNYSALIKQLDGALGEAQGGARLQLLLNRGFCLQQLGLFRKALKDYDAVLEAQPGHGAALLHRAKVLVALRQTEDALACLEELASSAALSADLAVLLEGQQLAAGIALGEVKEGAKLPLLPALAPPAPPPAPAPTAAAAAAPPAKPGFAPGFLSAAAAKREGVEAGRQKREAAAVPPAPATPAAEKAAPPAAPTASSSSSSRSEATQQAKPSSPQAGFAGTAASVAGPPAGPSAAVDPLHQLVARSDANQGVSLAVQMVNTGSCKEAVALLDMLLAHHPGNVGAYAARGTAKALLGQLQEAVGDFSAAIQQEPRFFDFYKRRGQALAALGDDDGAVRDLRQAIELSADPPTKAESHEELGRLYQKQKDYRRAQAEFEAALALAGGSAGTELLSALGLCQVSQGDLQEGIATYEKALQLEPARKDLWLSLGMALKELCWVERAEEALRKAAKLSGGSGSTAVHAYRLLAQMKQGLGDHLGAVQELNRGITATDKDVSRIELRFLRGACHHAVGQHREAVADYQQTLEAQAALSPGSSGELVSFICLAFYQKEMALYARANLDRHVLSFCPDADLHPEFKELWCKKGPPSAEFVSMYRAIMQPQHPNWSATRPAPPPKKLLLPLLEAADAVGQLVQYSHQGFLPNRRQQRMAGLAAIEFAQALQQLVADRRAGRETLVPDAGASVTARPSGPPAARPGTAAALRSSKKGHHPFGWRDAMDIIVRWRQLAEPNDQVIWVDLLTEREFNQGFGSHTPMFTGQTKCVRYYMVFHRALELMKRCLAAEGCAIDANNAPVPLDTPEKQAAAQGARTTEDMWCAIGTDSWVVVPIESTTRPGHTLEGTRLTVVNLGKQPGEAEGEAEPDATMQLANGVRGEAAAHLPARPKPQPDSYEFSIRTPVTPSRWMDYDEELEGMFERLAAALERGDAAGAAEAALRFAYYWYNFMPLARGSAFCGYVSMLAVFLAMRAPVRTSMPPSYQTDWEAILESSPERFLQSVSSWMYPPEVQQAQQAQQAQQGGDQEVQQQAGQQQQPAGQQQEGESQAGQQQQQTNGSSSGSEGGGSGGGSGTAAAGVLPCKPVDQLPKVIEVLSTMRQRLEALNGPDVPRI